MSALLDLFFGWFVRMNEERARQKKQRDAVVDEADRMLEDELRAADARRGRA